MQSSNDSYVIDSGDLQNHQGLIKAHPFPWVSHPVTLVFIVLSAVGNFAIFAMVCLSKTFRRPSNYLIANLCVASVYFMCVFCFYNVRSGTNTMFWEYNSTVCALLGIFQRLVIPILPYTITAISLDRSKAARNPLDHATNRTILYQIMAIWMLGLLITLPMSIIYQYDKNSIGVYKCTKVPLGGSSSLQTMYSMFVLAFVYLIPTYILIKEFITLREKMKFLTHSQVEQKKRFQHRLRLMQNSCIFTAIFIICWLPQGILHYRKTTRGKRVFQFPFDLPREMTINLSLMKFLKTARDISRQVVMLNTCLNPILLLLLSFDVREYLTSCSTV